MVQLTFNQKVGLGFAVIIVLLLSSGLSSLWNLNDINKSTSRVNETAVPVLKESNEVQIQLLKLARLSSLAFNVEDKEGIRTFKKQFEQGVTDFDALYSSLEELATNDADMHALVIGVKSNYDFYRFAVTEMFEAKEEIIQANEALVEEGRLLFDMADALGGALVEIQYFMAEPEQAESMELIAGYSNQADTNALAILKTIEEIQRASSIDTLGTMDDLTFALEDSRRWYAKGAELFKEFGDQTMLDAVDQAYGDLTERFKHEPSIIASKTRELQQAELARQKLQEADAAVSQSIDGLDQLLGSANVQFEELQSEVLGSLDFGFKLSIGMLIVLLILATQNFNSMRAAIRKKMQDLAKLNKIGGSLASAHSQNSALEEVLQSMHEKIGVSQGSVYLTNDDQKLVVKAHFPPRADTHTSEPTRFEMGQGILGKAAKTKEIIFVPNTENEKSYVPRENETSARSLLCVPLVDKDILVGVINLSGDMKEVSFADSDYEFASSVAQSLVTTIKTIRMREVIEEQNRNLEAKVEQRTAALHQKNRDIANMMANMHQGLFTVPVGGSVDKEYAAYLEKIFETDRISGRNVTDLLFSNSTIGSDSRDQCITAIDAIVGEDEMMYEFNSHCLVTEMTAKFDSGNEKILELDWDPILNDEEVVDKLMITVRDVTEVRQLEAAAAGQKRELELMGEVLAIDAGKFSEFLRGSKQFMAECEESIKNNAEKSADVIADLFRNMHTVKGNSRTYGLGHLTDIVHEVETTYDNMRNDESVEWNQELLLKELSEAQVQLAEYDAIFFEKLGRGDAVGGGSAIDPERIFSWLGRVSNIATKPMDAEVKEAVSEVYSMLLSVDSKTIADVIVEPIESTESMAEQLGKPKPIIDINDAGVYIDSGIHTMLNNIFMHVLRNGVDHGIECEEERTAQGKPAAGTISIDTRIKSDVVDFAVSDDGRGIALEKIKGLAIEKGIIAEGEAIEDQDVANLVFKSGFSTADEVSDLSGRGVGMDAVRQFLESEGGSIKLVLTDDKVGAAFRAFETVITLPERLCMQAVSFSESA